MFWTGLTGLGGWGVELSSHRGTEAQRVGGWDGVFWTGLTGLTGLGDWGEEELSHRGTEAQRVVGWNGVGVDWTGLTGLTGLGGWGVELSHRDTEAQRVGGWDGVFWTGLTGLGGWGVEWVVFWGESTSATGECSTWNKGRGWSPGWRMQAEKSQEEALRRGGVPVLRRKRQNPRRSKAAESWLTAGRLSPALSVPFLPIQMRPRSAVPAVMTMAWARNRPWREVRRARGSWLVARGSWLGGCGSPSAELGADGDCSTWNMGGGFCRKGRKGDCGRFRLSSPPAQAQATIGNRPRFEMFLTGLTGFGGWGVELSHRGSEAQRVGGWDGVGVDWTGLTGLGGWGVDWAGFWGESLAATSATERRSMTSSSMRVRWGWAARTACIRWE